MKDKKDRIIKLDGKDINLSKLSDEDLLKIADYMLHRIKKEKGELAKKVKELKDDIREIE